MRAAGDTGLAIELIGISKSFGPVQANRDIDLAVRRGTIHGIVGENGAGKSTLMSILYGFYQADAGEIRVNGRPRSIPDSRAAIAAGIGMVHQHFMLVEPFTVLENIVLGAEDGPLLRPSLAKARDELGRLERDYELEVDPDAVVGDLSVGLQQRVEILKALYRQADILILDEPTGVLTPAEADHLFRILGGLRDEGKTIILITHKLREIMAITDDVSVMRRGEIVKTLRTGETTPEELAELMVGRRVLLSVEKAPAEPGETLLEARNLSLTDARGVRRLRDVSLSVRAGEILGIAGVAGNGQSELLEILAGIRPATSGEVLLRGEPLDISRATSGAARREDGMAHVPEDRHRRGLVMPFPAWENACLGYQGEDRFSAALGLLDRAAIRDSSRADIERFDIRPPSCDLRAASFSGGNQQKIVIAREIGRDPDVLLVGQPTRGVDIGAIEFIHRQIVALRDRGKAIILVSVELDEIRTLSDRVIVMFDGAISGERAAAETDERELGLLMAGVDPGAKGAA
ncbi:ABC transporter ATP-binding protein [Amaricoccus sp. W119]|uniref:ABC transporter ATP-binding protein n=1 Tax=Amaricoccus sp. W119 TaxID=3391833 RepID=UPI0039A57A95